MSLKNSRVAIATVIIAVLAVAGAGTALAVRAANDLPEDAVFGYGPKVVTEADLSERVDSLEALYGVQPPAKGKAADRFRRDAAKSMALGLVMEHEAGKRDIVVSEKQERSELAKIISDRLAGDRAAFTRFLTEKGVTEQTILDEIGRTIATNRLYEEVTAKVDPATEAEARKEYDARRDDMQTPEQRELRNVVVASEAEARAVLAELDKGTAFGAVAKAVSLDASTRAKGGRLGLVEEADLDPAYAAAAFAAKAGGLFGPVRSQYGWNVGQVVRVVPGDPLTFAQVKDELVVGLTTRARLEAWRTWIEKALKEADVEYADRYRPADPTSAPSDSTPTTKPSEPTGEDR